MFNSIKYVHKKNQYIYIYTKVIIIVASNLQYIEYLKYINNIEINVNIIIAEWYFNNIYKVYFIISSCVSIIFIILNFYYYLL